MDQSSRIRSRLAVASMRIVLTDPGGYTPPYDHCLSAALARRGHEVELLTCPSRFGLPPQSDGYCRHEIFFSLTSRTFRQAPRSRLRLVMKAGRANFRKYRHSKA